MRALSLAILATLAAASPANAAETLTVYTYESFTAEWGPGPQVEKAFEAECGCDLKFVSVADGVALLNRVKLEGQSTKADIVLGLDTNLTADAKASGLFAPAGVDQSALAVPGGWNDDVFVPFDYGYFAVVYDTEKVPAPPKSLAELVEGDPKIKIVIEDPRTSTPGLGLVLWVKAVYGDQAADAWAKLKQRVLTVTPGWSEAYGLFTKGEAQMVLSYTTSPAYHIIAEGYGALPGRCLLGRSLSSGRGGRDDGEWRQEPAVAEIPCLHDQPGIPGRHPRNQLDVPGHQDRQAAQPGIRPDGEAGQDADLHPGRGCAKQAGLGRRMAEGDERVARRAMSCAAIRDPRVKAGVAALAGIVILIGGAFVGLAVEGAADFARALSAFDAYYVRVAAFTLWQAVLSTLLSVVPAIVVARALSRHPAFPGRGLVLRLFALPLALPAIVAALGILALFGRAGYFAGLLSWLSGGDWPGIYGLSGILVAHVFFNLPLATRLFLEALGTVPTDQWRLASQLGMGVSPSFRLIEWPVLRAALPAVAGLVFMLCVTSFTIVLTLGGGPAATTLEVAIYQALRFDFDPARAVALTFGQIVLTIASIWLLSRLGADPARDANLGVAPPRRFVSVPAAERAINSAAILVAALFVDRPDRVDHRVRSGFRPACSGWPSLGSAGQPHQPWLCRDVGPDRRAVVACPGGDAARAGDHRGVAAAAHCSNTPPIPAPVSCWWCRRSSSAPAGSSLAGMSAMCSCSPRSWLSRSTR